MRSFLQIVAIVLLTGFLAPDVFALENKSAFSADVKPKKWKSLGKRKVGFGNDKDEIKVGKGEGSFDKIKLEVKEGAIILKSIEVHFADGTSKFYRIRETMKEGDTTGELELPGNDRVISRIVLSYETSELFKDRARIEVFAK